MGKADRETLAENRVGVGERRYCEVIEVIEVVEQSSLLPSRPFSLVRYFTARSVTFFAHLHCLSAGHSLNYAPYFVLSITRFLFLPSL